MTSESRLESSFHSTSSQNNLPFHDFSSCSCAQVSTIVDVRAATMAQVAGADAPVPRAAGSVGEGPQYKLEKGTIFSRVADIPVSRPRILHPST